MGSSSSKPSKAPPTQPKAAKADHAEARQARERAKAGNIERRKRERAYQALTKRVAELEARIAEAEQTIKDVERQMAAPEFYVDHEAAKSALARHQELMWQVGELLGQWEMLQIEAEQYTDVRN